MNILMILYSMLMNTCLCIFHVNNMTFCVFYCCCFAIGSLLCYYMWILMIFLPFLNTHFSLFIFFFFLFQLKCISAEGKISSLKFYLLFFLIFSTSTFSLSYKFLFLIETKIKLSNTFNSLQGGYNLRIFLYGWDASSLWWDAV